jgi:hypothetical protein
MRISKAISQIFSLLILQLTIHLTTCFNILEEQSNYSLAQSLSSRPQGADTSSTDSLIRILVEGSTSVIPLMTLLPSDNPPQGSYELIKPPKYESYNFTISSKEYVSEITNLNFKLDKKGGIDSEILKESSHVLQVFNFYVNKY